MIHQSTTNPMIVTWRDTQVRVRIRGTLRAVTHYLWRIHPPPLGAGEASAARHREHVALSGTWQQQAQHRSVVSLRLTTHNLQYPGRVNTHLSHYRELLIWIAMHFCIHNVKDVWRLRCNFSSIVKTDLYRMLCISGGKNINILKLLQKYLNALLKKGT